MLHLSSGISFGVDVAYLLEFQGTFQGNGVIDAPAQVEEVAGIRELLCNFHYGTASLKDRLHLVGYLHDVPANSDSVFPVQRTLGSAQGKCNKRQYHGLAGECFG